MHRLSTIAFVGMLTLAIAGCGSDNENSVVVTPSASPGVKPQPGTKPFDQPPMVTQQPAGLISSAPALIQPTNPNQRAKQVETGRQDPFAGIFIQTGPSALTNPASQSTPQLPNLPVAGGSQTRTGQPGSGSAGADQTGSSRPSIGQQPSPVAEENSDSSNSNSNNTASQPSPDLDSPLPSDLPDSSSEAFLPPPPQEPDLASAVGVSGVIQIGDQLRAIVQVPNEGTSRYVQMGQRLSNGQVLVKRIEMSEGSEPVVILEQNGIEVAKAVGEKAANSEQTNAPTDGSSVAPPEDTPAPYSEDNSVEQPLEDGSSSPDGTLVSPTLEDGTVPTDDGLIPPPLEDGTVPTDDGLIPPPLEDGTVPTDDGLIPPPLEDGTVPTDDGLIPTPPEDGSSSGYQ